MRPVTTIPKTAGMTGPQIALTIKPQAVVMIVMMKRMAKDMALMIILVKEINMDFIRTKKTKRTNHRKPIRAREKNNDVILKIKPFRSPGRFFDFQGLLTPLEH
jgi:hypothetical protein